MRYTRDEVIQRTIREFKRLDGLVASLNDSDWKRRVPRPETKDPWTVKDALVHITYRKSNMVRTMLKQRRPADERGLSPDELKHLIYTRWRNRSPEEVLAWHRQVQKDVLAALKAMPEDWFSGRERGADWPYHLEGHSSFHRLRDIARALANRRA